MRKLLASDIDLVSNFYLQPNYGHSEQQCFLDKMTYSFIITNFKVGAEQSIQLASCLCMFDPEKGQLTATVEISHQNPL